MDSDKPTVVDAHAAFEGKLRGKDVQILGKFKGEIELTGRLILGEGSRVEAKVSAEQADIAGEFSGDLKVKNLVLLDKARVEGTLEAQNLAVREGAQLNGSVSSGSAAGSGFATVKSEVGSSPAPAAPNGGSKVEPPKPIPNPQGVVAK